MKYSFKFAETMTSARVLLFAATVACFATQGEGFFNSFETLPISFPGRLQAFEGPLGEYIVKNLKNSYLGIAEYCLEENKEVTRTKLESRTVLVYDCLMDLLSSVIPVDRRSVMNIAYTMKRLCSVKGALLHCYKVGTDVVFQQCLHVQHGVAHGVATYMAEIAEDVICRTDKDLLEGLDEYKLNLCLAKKYKSMGSCFKEFSESISSRPETLPGGADEMNHYLCRDMIGLLWCFESKLTACGVKKITLTVPKLVKDILDRLPCHVGNTVEESHFKPSEGKRFKREGSESIFYFEDLNEYHFIDEKTTEINVNESVKIDSPLAAQLYEMAMDESQRSSIEHDELVTDMNLTERALLEKENATLSKEDNNVQSQNEKPLQGVFLEAVREIIN